MNPGGSSSSGAFVGLNNGESGILRKTNLLGHHHHHHHHHHYGQDNSADLLVFGYSCKVFRDDEKARFIDQGRHLIPWMGDNQLKIDRYDARGALHDLSQHEPPIGGYGNRLDCLSPAEQRAEQLCEEERYHSLYANEVEEEIYQEEAAKRQAASGAQIPFNYDGGDGTSATVAGPEPSESAAAAAAADDENSTDPPFVAPTNFDIPTDLEVPDTMKEHAIIEKTAKFIASQDSQMEILLRAKQAANPQFDFLGPGGRLYRYYRLVLMAIKTNQYPEEAPEEAEPNTADAEPASDSIPETTEKSPEKAKVIVPAIKYKPSVDCAYTQLISKITGAPIPTKAVSDEANQDALSAPIGASQLTSLNSEFSYCKEEPSVEVKKVSTGLAGLVQYDSDTDDSASDADEDKGKEKAPEREVERREIIFTGTLPPEIFQHVIEKTAAYVAKNGYSFEEALRSKNDPRFLFLRKDHEFYPYYAFRVRYLIDPFEEVPRSPETVTIVREIENGTVVETPSIGIKTVNTAPVPVPAPPTQIQATKPGGAVCFSIKSKDDANVTLKSNVVQELGGDEEEVEAVVEKKEDLNPPTPIVNTEPPKEEPAETVETTEVVQEEGANSSSPQATDTVDEDPKESSSTPPLQEGQITPPITDEGTTDLKRLEERIKDKLAVAAREKLASISKEKQLQLERKRKASAFLSKLGKTEPQAEDIPSGGEETKESTSPSTTPPAPAKNGLELLRNQFSDVDEKNGESESEISIHSIPSQSDSPASIQVPSSADDDVVLVEDDTSRPSRSRTKTRSRSGSAIQKKRKHKHKSKSKSKSKLKKRKSRSRSRSRSPSRSKVKHKRKRSRSRSVSKSSRRSRSRSRSDKDSKKSKKSKKKSHKRHKPSRSSPSSRPQKDRKEKSSRVVDKY